MFRMNMLKKQGKQRSNLHFDTEAIDVINNT